jgi:rhodanese-related sulfurtransferase
VTPHIDAATLKAWLGDDREIALIDVSEHGQYGSGHPFFAVSLPYSRFELGLAALVPNPAVRLVLCDQGDGVAVRAAARAAAEGYYQLHILDGGKEAWRRAGYALYAGVNVPSKTFGELVAHERRTPCISAAAVQAMRDARDNFVIVDGRPFAEYRKMSIPGAICCPNGELALRIEEIAPDPGTKIVVNCAGRTRSIIGAQTLLDLGIPNQVFALENGTQGWYLAGLELEHGARQAPFRRRRRGGNPAAARACMAIRDHATRHRRGARRRPGLAARSLAHHLSVGCAHRRGARRSGGAGLPARARRPVDPGDRSMGGSQGRAAGAGRR